MGNKFVSFKNENNPLEPTRQNETINFKQKKIIINIKVNR